MTYRLSSQKKERILFSEGEMAVGVTNRSFSRLCLVKALSNYYSHIDPGVWRSWLARAVWDREVEGSSPFTPTIQ